MVLNQDGSIQLMMGATEIGQGADTVFSQMVDRNTSDRYGACTYHVHAGYGYFAI